MALNSIGPTGIVTATQQQLYNYFVNAYQNIYGSSINVASNTPDGQQINIFIQACLDNLNLTTSVFNSFDPDLALGTILDQRCAINGIQRQAATYTLTNVTVTTTQVVNLYGLDQSVQPVFTVQDAAGNQWQLVSTQLALPIGANVLLFQAANPGAVLTTTNTITIPVSIVLGVSSINNPSGAISVGINEESDAALRIRRAKSVSLQSQGYLKGLLGALENINGVTSALIWENNTSSVDSTGTQGHSIWVIVSGTPTVTLATAWNSLTTYSFNQIASYGGLNYISVANNNLGNTPGSSPTHWSVYNPIAQAIYNYRNAGCGLYSRSGDANAGSYNVVQIDGSNFPVVWNGVVSVPLFIKMTVGSLNGKNPPNIAAIQAAILAQFAPAVSAEVNINQITSISQATDANTLMTFPSGNGFSTAVGGTYTYSLTPTYLDNQFTISSSNIILLPIALTCPNGILAVGANGVQTGLTISVTHGGNMIQFSSIGGYGTLTYAVSGSGSINSATGLYTSGSSGTATVTVTDGLGNTQTATVSVI